METKSETKRIYTVTEFMELLGIPINKQKFVWVETNCKTITVTTELFD